MPDEVFLALLASAARSAIQLEMRDGYMVDDPDYADWRAGSRAPTSVGGPGKI
jgi:hypothetical protein